jgi:hypothetical protein
MATLLETYARQLNARQMEQLAKWLAVKTDALQKGLRTTGALLLGAVYQQSKTPQGADDLLASLNQDKELRSDALRAIEAGHGFPILNFLFGVGYPKVTAWVKDTVGVDVEPFLVPAAVLMMRALEEIALAEKFDAAGLAAYLQKEQDAFARAQPQLASQLNAALDLGQNTVERAERLMLRFTPEEWDTLARLPSLAASAVMMTDLSGPVGLNKEYTALLQALEKSAAANEPDSLVSLAARTYNEPSQIDALGVTPANARTMLRDGSLQTLAILNAKATHEEIHAYKKMVMDVARSVAQAAMDGGTLGIGRKPVSGNEQRALDLLAAALAYDA